MGGIAAPKRHIGGQALPLHAPCALRTLSPSRGCSTQTQAGKKPLSCQLHDLAAVKKGALTLIKVKSRSAANFFKGSIRLLRDAGVAVFCDEGVQVRG